jgi:hypothetical protein
MARKLSAKQLKYFGTKRQKAAARANRKRKRNVAHRVRSKPNKAMGYAGSKGWKARTKPNRPKRKRKNGAARRHQARKNPGAIYALVNPARKKGKSTMAGHKKNKKRQRRHNPAGYTKKDRTVRHCSRRNPGTFGGPMDWLSLGGGAVIGGLGATSLPQMVLGTSNTGPIGYLGMAASTALLAIAGHMVFKRNTMLTAGIIAGGAGALIKRIVGDYTPYGSYLGASGMGDYLANFNYPVPQIIGGNGNTALGTPGQIPVSVAGAGVSAAGLIGRPLY